MKITYLLHHGTQAYYSDKLTLAEATSRIRKAGFGVEIQDAWGSRLHLYEPLYWDFWKVILGDMPVSVHATMSGYPFPKDYDYVGKMRNNIDFVKYISAHTLIVHDFNLSPSTKRNTIADHGQAAEIIAYAEEKGVQIALENGNYETVAEALEKHPTLKACLDTGHAAHISEVPYKRDVPYHGFERMVDLVKPRLAHLHLHESRGVYDEHMVVGVRHGIGDKRWCYLLNALEEYDFDGHACFEVGGGYSGGQIDRSVSFLTEECGFNEPKHRRLPYVQSVLDPDWKRPADPGGTKLTVGYVASSTVYKATSAHTEIEDAMLELKDVGIGFEISDSWCGRSGHIHKRHCWDRWVAACKGMLLTVCGSPAPKPVLEDPPDTLQWIKNELDFCKYVGARIYVLSTEVIQSLSEDDLMKTNGSLAQALAHAFKQDIQVAAENDKLDSTLRVLDCHPSLGVCFDSGKARLDSDHSFGKIVDKLKDRIVHLHLHDNRGEKDEHQPPGIRGGLPIEDWQYLTDTLAKINYKGIACIETMPFDWKYVYETSLDYLCNTCGWPHPATNIVTMKA